LKILLNHIDQEPVAIYFGLTYSVNADNLSAISAIANED
jgi:hypothetical protein